MQNEWPHRMTDVYARLAPGATRRRARRRSCGRSPRRSIRTHPEAYPKSRGFDIVVTPWKDELTAKAKPTLMILLVTTVFVLDHRLRERREPHADAARAARARDGASAPRSARRRRCCGGSCSPRTSCCRCSAACSASGSRSSGLNLLIALHVRASRAAPARSGSTRGCSAFTLVVSTAMALLFAWAPRLTFLNDPVRAMAAGGGRSTGSRGPAPRAARARRQPARGVVHAARSAPGS